MLESFKKLRSLKYNRRFLTSSCGIALAAVFVTSIPAAKAAYEYSQDSTMPEVGLRIASTDATTIGAGSSLAPKLQDDLEVFKEMVKGRRTGLSSLIAAGQSTAKLTTEQSDTLRIELDSVNGIDNKLSGTTPPSYTHMLELAEHFDSSQSHINQLMSKYELRMVPTDPGSVLIGDVTVNLDAEIKRRAALEDQISSELASGQITGPDGARLRNMLNTLAVKEGELRKSASTGTLGGMLKPDGKVQVDNGLSKVSAALNSSVNM